MEIYITANNDQTLYVPELDETYHSRHGAIAESQHVFIEKGLKKIKIDPGTKIKIFEVGFGTGLNCLLACKFAIEYQTEVFYHAIEAYPIDNNLISNLNYGKKLNLIDNFEKIHKVNWEKPQQINIVFSLLKTKTLVQDFNVTESDYDIVFFDAFAKSKQPEMWDILVISKVGSMIKSDGIFVTYAATGQLRRDLKQNGFEVENPTGAHYKRQMTIGIKKD